MVKFLLLCCALVLATVQEEWMEYPEVIARRSFLYAHGDPFLDTRPENALTLWTPANSSEWLGNQRFPLWQKHSSEDSARWVLHLTFGNEVGDMLHQEPRFSTKESNRTPTIQSGVLYQGERDTLFARFDQIDHWLQGKATYRQEVSGHSVRLDPPHSSKSWFGENLPDVSLLQAGWSGSNDWGEQSLLHQNGWYWYQDRGGLELPIRLQKSFLDWSFARYRLETTIENWRTEDVLLKKRGAGYSIEMNASASWQGNWGRVEPGLWWRIQEVEGYSPWEKKQSVLPWVKYQLKLQEVSFSHYSSISSQLQMHTDSLLWHFHSKGILGASHQLGQGSSWQNNRATHGFEGLATASTVYTGWAHTSLFNHGKGILWDWEWSSHSALYTGKGAEYWVVDSTVLYQNRPFLYAEKETIKTRYYGARWLGELAHSIPRGNVSFAYRREFFQGNAWDKIEVRPAKHRASIEVKTKGFEGMHVTQKLLWSSRSYIRGWGMDEYIVDPFFEYNITLEQKINSLHFWISFLNPIVPEEKKHPWGAENRFRILSGVKAFF